MDTFTQLCQKAQQIQAKHASINSPRPSDRIEYRTSLAKVMAKAKEYLEDEKYDCFLQEINTSADIESALIYNMVFERYWETIVDPHISRLNAVSEQIYQICRSGVNEGVLDTLHDLRCEAYQIAKEIDENVLPKNKNKMEDSVDAFFNRLYFNLPRDQIEWIEWDLDPWD